MAGQPNRIDPGIHRIERADMSQSKHRIFQLLALLTVISMSILACRFAPLANRTKHSTETSTSEVTDVDLAETTRFFIDAYKADFSDEPNDWTVTDQISDDSSQLFDISDGVLNWKVSANRETSLGFMPQTYLKIPLGNFYYSATILFDPVNPPEEVGLTFRIKDWSNYYYVGLTPEGQVMAGAIINDKFVQFVEYKQADSYQKDAANKLGVLEYDRKYYIFVNDQLITQFENLQHGVGKFGLLMTVEKDKPQAVQIDRLDLLMSYDVDVDVAVEDYPTPRRYPDSIARAYIHPGCTDHP